MARGSGEECLREDGVARAHSRIAGALGVCRLRSDPDPAVRQIFDLLQRQPADIDQMRRLLDLELHQVQKLGAATDELRAGSRHGRYRCPRVSDPLVRERLHRDTAPATSLLAARNMGYAA